MPVNEDNGSDESVDVSAAEDRKESEEAGIDEEGRAEPKIGYSAFLCQSSWWKLTVTAIGVAGSLATLASIFVDFPIEFRGNPEPSDTPAQVGELSADCLELTNPMSERNDYSNADLAGCEMPPDLNLRDMDFNGARASGMVFNSGNHNGADFSDADLSDADIRYADYSRATFANADLSGASIHNAGIDGASFRGANLEGARFYELNICQSPAVWSG